jgi:hypothetical protein
MSANDPESPSGISNRVPICGREWNQKCRIFGDKILTKF